MVAGQHAADEAGYCLCGLRPLVRAFVGGLALAGVRSNRIHYEFFGLADEILAAACRSGRELGTSQVLIAIRPVLRSVEEPLTGQVQYWWNSKAW
jgi:ferredoxin-NADP reductase